METENIIEKAIKVDSVEDTEKKVILKSGKEKYFLWKHKQDGDQTKAFTQFQALPVQAGKIYEAQVSESPRSFTNEKGKLINYTERKINYFKTLQNHSYNALGQNQNPQGTSMYTQAPKTSPRGSNELTGAIETKLADIEGRIQLLEDAVFNPDIPTV